MPQSARASASRQFGAAALIARATAVLRYSGTTTADDPARLQLLHDPLDRHAAAQDVDGYNRVNHHVHSMVQALAAIEGGDALRAERAMHDHLMAQPAALKALQRAETQRRQA